MLLWENILLAINGLLSNKMRAFLTMLGIIIGIGSVIAIMTVGDSLTMAVSSNMQSMGANDIYVMLNQKSAKEDDDKGSIDGVVYGTLGNTGELLEEDLITTDQVHEMTEKFKDEIYAINIELSGGTTEVSDGINSTMVSLSGVTAGFFVTNELTMIAGSMFSEKDFTEGINAILVSDDFVDSMYDGDAKKAVGEEIEIATNGNIGTFTIVGVYEYENTTGMMMTASSATTVYMPFKALVSYEHSDETFYYLQVVTKVGVDADKLASKIEKFFEPYYRNNRNYEVTAFTLGSMVSMVTDMLSTITIAISVIAAIALVVGGIGVMNIMLVSVTERTREIGTRKALGATNTSIKIQFIVEAMIICLIGGLIGVILGITAGTFFSNMLGAPASASITSILISLIFSMSIGVFFGYYPANKAAKMNPIDALRYE